MWFTISFRFECYYSEVLQVKLSEGSVVMAVKDRNIFDKEKIIAFGQKYDIFPDDVKEEVLKALEEIKKDEFYSSLCEKLLDYMKKGAPIGSLAPDFKEGRKAEFALFFPVWYMAEESVKDLEKRGVSLDIIHKSFKSICGCIAANKNLKGRMGTSAYFSWLPLHARGELFRIGDFQYEKKVDNGKLTIEIHIPSGTKLDVRQNLLSFKEALDFFEKYYPELEFSQFLCKSWLLSKEIEEVMGKKTNISRFGDMFERFSINDTTGDSVYRFVYKMVPPYPPVDELPEDTTLQKKLKEYIKSGKMMYAYGGLISKERLYDMLKNEEI